MKKIIITTVFAFAALFANAQLKVHSTGKVSVFSTTTPNQALDVTGDVSHVATTNAFRIGNNYMLWNNAKAGCIYVGQGGTTSTNTGINNTFIGFESGVVNGTGNRNLFAGTYSGNDNTSGQYNTFTGYNSGGTNIDGHYNTQIGYNAGYFNTTGDHNTCVGNLAGYDNTGSNNTLVGSFAGENFTSGSYNTALGYIAGNSYTTSTNCTFIGYNSESNNNYDNSTALGANTTVNAADKIRLGNGSVTVIEGNPLNYTTSDGRFKFNVQENVSGLDFIKRLRPVTYQFDTQAFDEFLRGEEEYNDSLGELPAINYGQSTNLIRTGFIAQEVEEVALETGYISDLVHSPNDEKDNYSLAYGGFVVPLVKAVQEQQAQIEELQAIVRQCCAAPKNFNIQNGIIQNEQGRNENGTNAATQVIELAYSDNVILYQNIPNPFGDETTINYYLPQTVSSAKMVFYDHMGKVIKEEVLSQKGNASVIIKSSELASGVYSYSLVVDEKVAGTKMMVKAK